jgi:hypothetical protein
MEPKKDRRGCPPGQGQLTGTVCSTGEAGGRIGNPPHIYDPAIANEIKTLAKVVSQDVCAQAVGISTDTLQRHYLDDFNEGKRQAIAAVGAKLLSKALAGHTAEMIFYLKTQGGYSTKMEVSGPGGEPIRQRIDLTGFLAGKSEEELGAIESVLEALAAAGGIDVAGMLGVGDRAGAGSEAPIGDGAGQA